MPHFFCRLATEDGRVFTQSILASSLGECRKHFESEGMCVLSIKKDWKKFQIPVLPFERKIKDGDIIMFNQELIALIRAGYPLLKSFEIIVSRVKNVHLKEILMKVENEVRGGKSLSEAFAPHEKIFSKVYTASLMAGEQSGNLAGTISRFNSYAKVIAQTKARVRSAFLYPTLLLLFSFVLMAILIHFVLPRFASFYEDFEAQLPLITRGLISFSLAVRDHAVYLAGFVLLLIVVYTRMRKKEKSLVFLDKLKLKIPYGRTIWIETAISLFCRTLGLLLGAGISLLTSLGISSRAVPNRHLVRRMKDLPELVKNGESLSDSMGKAGFFSPLALDLIRIGETSANLEGMLTEVADVYDERVRTRIDTFVSLIEPLVIIFMGLIVAAMLLSVYLPIFNIIRVTR